MEDKGFNGRKTEKGEKMTQVLQTFIRKKPMDMLLEMNRSKDNYASLLAKKTDCTYSHVVKLLVRMEKDGLVAFDKSGRIKNLNLTPKGTDLANEFSKINSILAED